MDKEYSKYDYQYASYWAKKIKAINMIGGICSRCGENNPILLEFHHTSKNKEYTVGDMLFYRKKWDEIKIEAGKCILMCRNCHMEFHFKDEKSKLAFKKNVIKEKLLEIKGGKKCSLCGYVGRNMASLSFHHRVPSAKSINLAASFHKKMLVLISEIEKCDILCGNCHRIKHINIKRFNKVKDIIDKKVKNYVELQKTDFDQVAKMYEGGMSRKEISKVLGRSGNTIKALIAKGISLLKIKKDRVCSVGKEKHKSVFMYTENGIDGYFSSIALAGKWLLDNNITSSKRPQSAIAQCCRGEFEKAYGYKWMAGL